MIGRTTVSVLALSLAAVGTAQAAPTHAIEITANAHNVRNGVWGTPLGVVSRGDRFAVSEERQGWSKIHWQGRNAWISSSYARRLSSTSVVEVETGALNVRSRGTTAASRIGMVADGQDYVLLDQVGNWQKIQYDNRIGWVSASFTRMIAVGGSSSGGDNSNFNSSTPGGPTRHPAMSASASELEVLARICKGEAGVCSYEGKVAVCAVVLNRVRSHHHPNTITRVAHQPYQFSCYNSNVRDRLYWGAIPTSCWDAAREALTGVDPTHGSTFYFNPFLVTPSWAHTLEFVVRIGTTARDAHDFYRPRH